MSTTQRVVRKQLAGAEDLLQGVGTVTQTRGTGTYPIHKLDIPIPTYDIAEMQASSAEFMRLYGTDTAYTDYRRNPEGTIGIPSNLGGVWEPMRSSEYLVCGNFATGAYVFSSDCIVALDQQSYNWQGSIPKVVAAGATPATSGGIGAGAWVDRTDVVLRQELASFYGASMVGQASYSQIRSYSGSATCIYCYGRTSVFDKAEGVFIADSSDTTSTDNDGTVLVDVLGRRWKRQFRGSLSLYWWGADSSGSIDASPAFQRATLAGGSSSIMVDGVMAIKTPVEVTKRLVFNDGGRIKIDSGIVFKCNIRPQASPDQWIFDGAPTTNVTWKNAYVDWFGADYYGFGVAAQNALNVTNAVMLNPKDYNQGLSAMVVPQGRSISVTGHGFRQTRIAIPANKLSINYQRAASQSPSSLVVENIEFVEVANGRTSVPIQWLGYSAGTPGSETVINDDNWLRVKRCVFTGVDRGVFTKFAGQCHFEENMSLFSNCMHFKERGSSFHYHLREMCLAGKFVNGSYIYADDPVNDAYSNGLFVDSCNSVTGAGIDIRMKNWQAVFVDKSGMDLGSAGQAAIWMQSCQDVQIDSCWIASTPAAAAAGRYGIHLDSCRNSNISKCTIVNNKRGINGQGATSIGVSDTTFEANLDYDIADSGVSVGWAIHGTRHRTTVSSGTPIWLALAGGGSHTVVGAIMKQATHTIPLGVNSQAVGNVFGAALS